MILYLMSYKETNTFQQTHGNIDKQTTYHNQINVALNRELNPITTIRTFSFMQVSAQLKSV